MDLSTYLLDRLHRVNALEFLFIPNPMPLLKLQNMIGHVEENPASPRVNGQKKRT